MPRVLTLTVGWLLAAYAVANTARSRRRVARRRVTLGLGGR
jgi:hypothetical protein